MKKLLTLSIFVILATISSCQSNYNKDIYPLIKKEMYTEAMPLLEEFLVSNSTHVNANYWCAKILESEGKRKSSASMLEKSIAHYRTCSQNVNVGDMTMLTAVRYPDAQGVESEIRLASFKEFIEYKIKELSGLKSKIQLSNTLSQTVGASTTREGSSQSSSTQLFRTENGGGYEIKDANGKLVYVARYFDNQTEDIQIETIYEGDKITKKSYAKDSQNNIFLFKLTTQIKVISTYNNQPYAILDGLQMKYEENINTARGNFAKWQKEECFYEKNVLKYKTLYYPSSDKVFCKIISTPVVSKVASNHRGEFPGQTEFSIPSKVTYYHQNGQIMLSYNPAIFNTWKWNSALVTSRSGGGIYLFKLVDYFPELADVGKQTLDADSYLPDDDNGNFRKQEITSDNTFLELFDNNGLIFKKITLVKTETSEEFKYKLDTQH